MPFLSFYALPTQGFSFTQSVNGFPKSGLEAVTDMYEFITQFFQLFPELQQNDFYLGGISYSGGSKNSLFILCCKTSFHSRPVFIRFFDLTKPPHYRTIPSMIMIMYDFYFLFLGVYSPALAHHIHLQNEHGDPEVKINLKGALLAAPAVMDVALQGNWGEAMYRFGLIDEIWKEVFDQKYSEFLAALEADNWGLAKQVQQSQCNVIVINIIDS
jgi:hypothetical protein